MRVWLVVLVFFMFLVAYFINASEKSKRKSTAYGSLIPRPKYPCIKQLYVLPYSISYSNAVTKLHEEEKEENIFDVNFSEMQNYFNILYQFKGARVAGRSLIKLNKETFIKDLGSLVLQGYNYQNSHEDILIPDKRSKNLAAMIIAIQKKLYPFTVLDEQIFGFYIQELVKKIAMLPLEQMRVFLYKIPRRYDFNEIDVWRIIFDYLRPDMIEDTVFPQVWLS